MKNLSKFIAFLAVVLLLAGCRNYQDCRYKVVLPPAPQTWTALLGQPHWRIQWLSSAGQIKTKDIRPGENLTVDIPVTWTSPVTAWPWWPEYDLIPGLFKPAGGFFPHEVSGERIKLSWEAGPDSVYYWELVYANSSKPARIPANFDWLRFRELFTTGVLNEEVCKDPWLVDWKSVAERTIASGFDRRRLAPQAVELITIPVSYLGPWYPASPFAEPLVFEDETPGSALPIFPVRSGVNVWVCDEGILRVSGDVWIFYLTQRHSEE